MEHPLDTTCGLLVRSGLLTEPEVQALKQRWQASAGPDAGDGERFLRWLVEDRQLTSFQADRLLRGQADHFFFDQYKLLDRLGQGRMAGVYKAVHKIGQVVAIKVLPPSKVKDAQAFGRFQREARLAVRLKHPNVVRTFHPGQADKLHYLVMEHLDGETLEEVLKRRGKLPADEAVRLVHQALGGLQHIHELGMIHRDLAPGNLMLVPGHIEGQPDITTNATVKILDIGLGRVLFDESAPAAGGGDDKLTALGQSLGTPDYTAPEQARDAHKADIRADIYTLGCVLYHALTGQPPFPGGNPVQKMLRHARETPKALKELVPGVPDGVQAIVSRMLAKDSAARYATPAEAVRAMEAFLKRDPADAARAAPAELVAYESWLSKEPFDFGDDEPAPTLSTAPRKAPPPPPPATGGKLPVAWIAGAVGAAVVVLGAIGYTILSWPSDKPVSPDHPAQPGKPEPPEQPKQVKKAFEDWLGEVKALPAEKQVEAVTARLKEHNPSFGGPVKPELRDGAVVGLEFPTDEVSDLSPLQALTGLTSLNCAGSAPGLGKLSDLAAIRAMPLTVLDCSNTRVSDLSPLKDMPLVYLGVAGTQVRDLSPIEGAPLLALNCSGTHVAELAPLKGMKLTSLDAADVPVTDLSPLRDMPLQTLWADVVPRRDAELLVGIASLKEVNGKPLEVLRKAAAEQKQDFEKWVKEVAALPAGEQVEAVAARLKERNAAFDRKLSHKVEGNDVAELRLVSDGLTDLSPLRALPRLKRLYCNGSKPGAGKLSDLTPLRALPLTELDCSWTQVRDLTPIRGMRLTRLFLAGCAGVADLAPLKGMPLRELNLEGAVRLRDLAPLKGMPLTRLNVAYTDVRDLAPIRGMKLTSLAFHRSPVGDLAALKDMPLKSVTGDFRPERDDALLRSLTTLDRINNRPAEDYRKDADARRKAHEAFVKEVRSKPAEEQVEAVAARLKELNPGFDGKVTHRIDRGIVRDLALSADTIKDLSPVQALPDLFKLSCTGSAPGKGKLEALPGMKGLSIRELDLSGTAVRDLSPLKDLARLEKLSVADTLVDDLSPVTKKPLEELDVTRCPVESLEPLKTVPLQRLRCSADVEVALGEQGPIKTLKLVNGKAPTATATAVAAARPARKKLTPTSYFTSLVVENQMSRRTLVVQLREPVVTVSGHHLYWLTRHQVGLLEAQLDRNLASRIRRIRHHVMWIAFHQAQVYQVTARDRKLDLKLDDDVKVRTIKLPPAYDEKGSVRKRTPAELKELKGPDTRLPGYTSGREYLSAGQVVQVHLEAGQVKAKPKGKAPGAEEAPPEGAGKVVDPRPKVVMVVVQ
jgi:serine/threonine protein kinase/Leucine-rich repeat (LRR) protein